MTLKQEDLDKMWESYDRNNGLLHRIYKDTGLGHGTIKRYIALGRDYVVGKIPAESNKYLPLNIQQKIKFRNIDTIEKIIECCEEEHGIILAEKAKQDCIKFLEFLDLRVSKELKKKENPQHYVLNIVDRLMLFSYLIGITPITAGHKAFKEYKEDIHEEKIKSACDLYLLRKTEIGTFSSIRTMDESKRKKAKKTDLRLIKIYNRFTTGTRLGFKSCTHYIDEISEYEPVRKHLLTNWRKKLAAFEKKHGINVGEKQRQIIRCYETGEKYKEKIIKLSDVIKASCSPNPLTSNHGGYRWNGRKT